MNFLELDFGELDIKFELTSIYQSIDMLYQAKDDLDDKASTIRVALESEGVSFNAYKKCVHEARKSVLIDCYTLSEKLYKSYFYQLLGYDEDSTDAIQKFLGEKINPDKFSPNVKFQEMIKDIKKYYPNFNPFISSTHQSINIYDEMVRDRHKYAHANNYNDRTKEQFIEILKVIEYLAFELDCLLHKNDCLKTLKSYIEFVEDSSKMKNFYHFKSKCIDYFSTGSEEKVQHINYPSLIVEQFDGSIENFMDACRGFKAIDFQQLSEEHFNDIVQLKTYFR
ncbi:MAG: hypothetical protein HFE53_07185 [Turicibacter sp.]|nr:hypothetical protein [Turicibacter sp.]